MSRFIEAIVAKRRESYRTNATASVPFFIRYLVKIQREDRSRGKHGAANYCDTMELFVVELGTMCVHIRCTEKMATRGYPHAYGAPRAARLTLLPFEDPPYTPTSRVYVHSHPFYTAPSPAVSLSLVLYPSLSHSLLLPLSPPTDSLLLFLQWNTVVGAFVLL